MSKALNKGSFAKSVSLLAGGTTVAQAINVVASPVLTRLYEPAEFGLFAQYLAILALLTVVGSLRYELAIPLPEEDSTARALLRLSLVIVLGIAFVVGLILLVVARPLAGLLESPQIRPYLWLLVPGVASLGLYQAISYWAVREKAFARLARAKLLQGFSGVGTQVGLGLARIGAPGLLIGHLVGYVCGTALLSRSIARRPTDTRPDYAALRRVAIRYRRFPLLSTVSAFLNSLTLQLPILWLASLYAAEMVGLLSLSQRVLALPATLIAAAVAQVYFAEAARLAPETPDRLPALFAETLRTQVLIGVAAFVLIVLPAPWVFGFVFGPAWQEAGWYLLALSPAYFFQFIGSPLGATLDVLERQDLHLLREVLRAALVIGALAAATVLHVPPLQALLLLALGACLGTAIGVLLAWYAVMRWRDDDARTPE